MSAHTICFQFMNKGDTLRVPVTFAMIEKIASDTYTVQLTLPSKKTFEPVILSGNDVFRWVRRMIGLLEADAEPFQFIQVDLPTLPTVLIRVSELSRHYHTILNAVEFQLDHWPASEDDDETYYGTRIVRRGPRTHMYFD